MGLAAGDDPAEAVAELNQRLGLPASLAAMGVPESVPPTNGGSGGHRALLGDQPAARDGARLFGAAWGVLRLEELNGGPPKSQPRRRLISFSPIAGGAQSGAAPRSASTTCAAL